MSDRTEGPNRRRLLQCMMGAGVGTLWAATGGTTLKEALTRVAAGPRPAMMLHTDDAAPALAYLKRFGSVTILNGHIHQVVQKVEGNITFHTARSTSFPQAAPGVGPGPDPLKVPAEQLRSMLGVRQIDYVHGHGVALTDATLGA